MSESTEAEGWLPRVDRSSTIKELQASVLESSKQTQAEWQARVQAESRLEALEARLAGLSYQLEQEREKSQSLAAQLEELSAEKDMLAEELQAAEQLSAFHADRAQQQLEDMRERLQAAEDQLSAQHEAREHPGGLGRGRVAGVAELVQQHSAVRGSGEGALEQLELLRDKVQDYRAENFSLGNQLAQERTTTAALRSSLSRLEHKLSLLLQATTTNSNSGLASPSLTTQQHLLPVISQILQELKAAELIATATAATPAATLAPALTSFPQTPEALGSATAALAGSGTIPNPAATTAADVPSPDTTASNAIPAAATSTGAATNNFGTESDLAATTAATPASTGTTATTASAPTTAVAATAADAVTLESRISHAVHALARLWSKYGDNPWHRGIVKGIAEIVQLLADSGAQDAAGHTALHIAAARGQADIVSVLLQGGAKVQAVDASGRTGLHAAAEKGHVEVVKVLVQAGAHVGARNHGGDTPLHCAAGYGQDRVVSELLLAGADPMEDDDEGCSALQRALLWGYAGTAMLLLQAMTEKMGMSPAAGSGHSVRASLDAESVDWVPAQKLLDEQAQALLMRLQAAPGDVEANKGDMERVLAVQAQLGSTLRERASPLLARCNEEALIACLSPSLGFYRGRPVAAILLFRCLLHWNIFSSETTTFFQRALFKIGSQLDDSSQHAPSHHPDDGPHGLGSGSTGSEAVKPEAMSCEAVHFKAVGSEAVKSEAMSSEPGGSKAVRCSEAVISEAIRSAAPSPNALKPCASSSDTASGHDATLAYWLCNATALLAVLQETLRPVQGYRGADMGASKGSKPGAALLAAVRSHWNALRDMPLQLNLPLTRNKQQQQVEGSGQGPSDAHVPAHLPALVFKRQLDLLIVKTFNTLRDNAKARLSQLLPACTHQDRGPTTTPGADADPGNQGAPGWPQLVSVLGELLKTADSNCLAPAIVGKLFHHLLVFLDTNLFNQLLLRRECCSFSNARYLAEGLTHVDSWFTSIGRDVLGSAPRDLEHIRQAVHFLMLSSKSKQSLQHIASEVCPALSLSQVYVLCTKFFDDEHGTGGVAPEVLGEMQAQLGTGDADASRSFLLDDSSSAAPLAVMQLLKKMPPQDLLSAVPIPDSLAKASSVQGAFTFLESSATLMAATPTA